MKRAKLALIFITMLAMAGCAMGAKENLAKVKTGMTPDQVQQQLGPPEAVKMVQFPKQNGKFVVWQYEMVADTPNCPSKLLGRSIAGLVTLGMSEIAFSHAEAEPHWVYFEDGKLTYASRAVDCAKYDCKVWNVEIKQVSSAD